MKYIDRIRNMLSAFALLLLCVLFLRYRNDASSGVLTGIHTCLNTLVPSLFPFVLLACLIARSPSSALLFRPLAPVMRCVFRLPACAAPALVFGLTAGYPTGAKLAASLYADGRLTEAETARLLCFCTSPGYAFAAVYTGSMMLSSAKTGLFLFLSCLFAPLLTGFILSRFAEKPKKVETRSAPVSGGLTDSVREGVEAMVSMCGFVVVFSALLSVLHGSGLFQHMTALLARLHLTVPYAGTLLSFLLEVTSGVRQAAYWHVPGTLTAFGLGFGGLCIHLQIFSFFRDGFPMEKSLYLLSRAANGFLAALFFRLLAHFSPLTEPAAALSASALRSASGAGSAAASAALLALSLFFLLTCMQKDRLCENRLEISASKWYNKR